MISLKKFLNADHEKEEALERVFQLLLQGIVMHAIQGVPEDYAAFQESIRQIFEAINKAGAAQDYLVQAGAAIRSIEEYHRRTARYLGQRRGEMQKIIGMLTSAISSISEASNENLRRLREIEDQVASASEIEDVRLLKARLSECLEDIRRESARQKTHTRQTVEQLSSGLERARSDAVTEVLSKPAHLPSPPVTAIDSVTRLPGRTTAEAAMERACCLQEPVSAALVVLDSLPAISSRFGRGAGDEVLQAFGDYLAQKLAPEDEMFRWSGLALVALLRRSGKIERVREEFARLMEQKFEHTMQTSSRAVLLPVAKRWAVLPVVSPPAAIFSKMDNFVSPALERE